MCVVAEVYAPAPAKMIGLVRGWEGVLACLYLLCPAAALVVAFGNVDSSSLLSAVLQGRAIACQYRTTLSGVQNALQGVYRVEISSTASALFSGMCLHGHAQQRPVL